MVGPDSTVLVLPADDQDGESVSAYVSETSIGSSSGDLDAGALAPDDEAHLSDQFDTADNGGADVGQNANPSDVTTTEAFADGASVGDSATAELPGAASADVLLDSIGKAPTVEVKPWPPPCDKPGIVGDGGKGYDGKDCFGPPNYCMYAGGASEDYACSLDGEYCCAFSSTCKPCGWVSCYDCQVQGPPCPDGCKLTPPFWQMPSKIWLTQQCKSLAKLVNDVNCAVCSGGTDLYCKWAAPP